jgi:hypothetical protein
VPEACAAGFEIFIVIASKSPGFHDVKGKEEAEEMTNSISTESILITGESNWIQTKTVIWFVLFVLFFWLNETNQMNQINQISKTNQINQTNQRDQMTQTGYTRSLRKGEGAWGRWKQKT